MRNTKDLVLIKVKLLIEPATAVIISEKISTTTVRIAVATSESVFLIPHFASMAVMPAKKADKTAVNIHIFIASMGNTISKNHLMANISIRPLRFHPPALPLTADIMPLFRQGGYNFLPEL